MHPITWSTRFWVHRVQQQSIVRFGLQKQLSRDQLIRETFSDEVIIVDEAHHLRSSQDTIEANDALNTIVRNTSNVKLICWHTPMFDKASEIINLSQISCDSTTGAVMNWMSRITSTTTEIWQTQVAWQKRVGDTYRGVRRPVTFPTQLSPSVKYRKTASSCAQKRWMGQSCTYLREMIELVTPMSELQGSRNIEDGTGGGNRKWWQWSSSRQISTIVSTATVRV
jgi:hypothetical protein